MTRDAARASAAQPTGEIVNEGQNQVRAQVGYGSGQQAAQGDSCNQMAEGRQSAKSVLREHIHRLRREADRLEALAEALPEKLPHLADSALWDLLISARR